MARLGVIGWPVGHSRSPAMHAAALAAAGLEGWRYQRLPVPPLLFSETVRGLGPAGFLGANVTIPHKVAALAVADRASTAAREIGAANTLTFHPDGTIEADNTDAAGFLAALPRSPAGLRTVVLGAGGSARAVVWALRHAGAARVSVLNRSADRAQELARSLGAEAVTSPPAAELLVNCTAIGLDHSSSASDALKVLGLDLDDLPAYTYVVDLVYRDGLTPLLTAARDGGAEVVEGLEILVRQGALSFERWTGRAASIEAMRRAARSAAA